MDYEIIREAPKALTFADLKPGDRFRFVDSSTGPARRMRESDPAFIWEDGEWLVSSFTYEEVASDEVVLVDDKGDPLPSPASEPPVKEIVLRVSPEELAAIAASMGTVSRADYDSSRYRRFAPPWSSVGPFVVIANVCGETFGESF